MNICVCVCAFKKPNKIKIGKGIKQINIKINILILNDEFINTKAPISFMCTTYFFKSVYYAPLSHLIPGDTMNKRCP